MDKSSALEYINQMFPTGFSLLNLSSRVCLYKRIERFYAEKRMYERNV